MASRGINKVILIGNLGSDPETRYMPNGQAVSNVSIATAETWKDKQSGDPRERTEWHRVVFYRGLGEIVGQYLTKGSKVYVHGSLRTRKWQAKDGHDRYTTEIVANDLQVLDTRSSESPAQPTDPFEIGPPDSFEDEIEIPDPKIVPLHPNNGVAEDDIPF